MSNTKGEFKCTCGKGFTLAKSRDMHISDTAYGHGYPSGQSATPKPKHIQGQDVTSDEAI